MLATAKALAKHAGRMLREVERRRGGGVAVKPTRGGKVKPEE
jgi:hypothetical protein